MSFFHPPITVNLPPLSPSSVGKEIQGNQSILRCVGQKVREGFDDLLGTSGICALAAKCQAQIKEKLPSGSSYSSHTRTISPLPCLSVTGPLPLFLQPPPLLLPSSASLPRNRAYLSLRSCKQSNSKLPAIVTHSATVTTEPGEALRIAEEENARRIGGREGRREEENPFCERL